jgi:hypothetical protein
MGALRTVPRKPTPRRKHFMCGGVQVFDDRQDSTRCRSWNSLSFNSKCTTAGPDGLRCCHAKRSYRHMSAEDRETLSVGLAHGHSLRTMQACWDALPAP